MPVTEYDAVVLEVFKSYGSTVTGTIVRLTTIGGRAEWNGRDIVMRRRAPDLKAGATYLVMLTHAEDWNGDLMLGDDDVYGIESGRVTATGIAADTDYGRELIGVSEAAAVERFRAAAR